jgi:uncharacterized protein YjbI with pentapeptide repeats
MCVRFLLIAAVFLAGVPIAHAQKAQRLAASEMCSRLIDTRWTPAERFVWNQTCRGDEADFNKGSRFGGKHDPREPRGLPSSRKLRSSFLRTILSTDKYKHVLTSRGIRINGARFTDRLELDNIEVNHEIWLDNSLFEKGVSLIGFKSTRPITFDGSKVVGTLDLRVVQIDNMYARDGAQLQSVTLERAIVANILDLSDADIEQSLIMTGIRIGGYLNAAKVRAREILLSQARVGSHLTLTGAIVPTVIDMNGIDVGGHVMIDSSVSNQIKLSNAIIRSHLDLSDSKAAASIDMAGIQITRNLTAENINLAALDLTDAHIGGVLNLKTAKVTTANMDSLQVGAHVFMDENAEFGEIDLSNADFRAHFFLRTAKARRLQMDELQVAGNLLMNESAEFDEVHLLRARIGGVLNLRGATVRGQLNFESIQVGGHLFMDEGAKFGDVNLLNATLRSYLFLSNSTVSGDLNLERVQLGGGIRMNDAHLANIKFVKGQVGDYVDLTEARIIGPANFTELRVGGNFVADKAQLNSVSLHAARISGRLRFQKAKLKDTLDMTAVQAGSTVFIDSGTFTEIDLTNARFDADFILVKSQVSRRLAMDAGKIGGIVDLRGSTFDGVLTSRSTEINQDMFMGGAHFGRIDFTSAKVKESLDWTKAVFVDDVNLSGAQIGRKFILGDSDRPPPSVSLIDFTFSRAEWGDDPLDVLRKLVAATTVHAVYSPALYDRVATSYGELGQSGIVRSILIEKQNAEFEHASSFWERGYLFITWVLAGYGYRPEIGFAWIGLFVFVGAIIFKSGAGRVKSETVPDNWLVFAIDAVIPGIHLNSEYDKVKFSGWRQNFLYFMRFLGAVLIVLILQFLKQSVLGPR